MGQHCFMQRLLVPAVLAVLALMVVAGSAQADCKGKVGDFEYDLSPLAAKIGAVDLQATDDATNQVYYYRVCGVVSIDFCQTVSDNTPAVCQKDSRAQYHDSGNQKTAEFQRLPSGSDSDGFTLAFSGGQERRGALVHFQCNMSEETGTLAFLKEDPIMTYNLQFSTKYACPVPTPTPAPSRHHTCCLYADKTQPRVTKTICSSICPTSLGSLLLAGNWNVTACSDCVSSGASALSARSWLTQLQLWAQWAL